MISVDHPALSPRRPAWCLEHGYEAVEGCRACAARGLPAPHQVLRMDTPRSVEDLKRLWGAWFERMGPDEFVGWEAAFRAYWKAVTTTSGSETGAIALAAEAYFAWEDDAGGDRFHHLDGGLRDRD